MVLAAAADDPEAFIKSMETIDADVTIRFHRERMTVYPSTEERKQRLAEILLAEGVHHHRHGSKGNRASKVVLRNLPNFRPESIAEDIKSKGLEPIKVVKMEGEQGHTFLLLLAPGTSMAEAKQKLGKTILSARVVIATYTSDRVGAHCRNCQRFGHSAGGCGYPPRCIKCPLPHASRDCPKPRTEKAQCTNCMGPHAASFGKCPAYLKYAATFNKKPAPRKPPPPAPKLTSKDFPTLPRVAPNVDTPAPPPPHLPRTATSSTAPGAMDDFFILEKIMENMRVITASIDLHRILRVTSHLAETLKGRPKLTMSEQVVALADALEQHP